MALILLEEQTGYLESNPGVTKNCQCQLPGRLTGRVPRRCWEERRDSGDAMVVREGAKTDGAEVHPGVLEGVQRWAWRG